MLDAALAILLFAAITWALVERYRRLHLQEVVDESCDEMMAILKKQDEEDGEP
jgi:hypothetical protein